MQDGISIAETVNSYDKISENFILLSQYASRYNQPTTTRNNPDTVI